MGITSRPKPPPDGITRARLNGIASRHAGRGDPAGEKRAEAIAELRECAGDRPDLLTEVAGILLGALPETDLMYAHHQTAAGLLLDALTEPVNTDELERWQRVGEGRRPVDPRWAGERVPIPRES